MIDYYHYRPTEPEEYDAPLEEEHQPQKHHRFLKWLFLGLFLLLLTLGGVFLAGYWYLQNTALANTNQRTNILVLGVDEAAKLSDTIMLVSIDHGAPSGPDIALLSIPRDLYLTIPGYHGAKINSAYAVGENNDHPGGGPALTRETLAEHLDLPIHYYFSLDFDGFEAVVDAVGGVEVEVATTINDPRYPDESGGFDPLYIESGSQEMDGELALKYARSRKSTNDFDRAYRQQQILLAVRDELTDKNLLWRPQTAGSLLRVFESHVDTDFTRFELLKFIALVRNSEFEETPQYVLDTTNLLVGTNNETGAALIPRAGDFSEVRRFVDHIFDQADVNEFSQQQF